MPGVATSRCPELPRTYLPAALSRGTAFGALYLTSALGGMLGALFATNMGHTRPFGLEGWRIAFVAGVLQKGIGAHVYDSTACAVPRSGCRCRQVDSKLWRSHSTGDSQASQAVEWPTAACWHAAGHQAPGFQNRRWRRCPICPHNTGPAEPASAAVGAASLLIGLLNLLFAVDPRYKLEEPEDLRYR